MSLSLPRRRVLGTALALLISGALAGCARPRRIEVVVLPPVDPPYWAIPRGYGITHAAPRYSDGRRTGVVVGGVVPGSLADRMGLQRNDVLVVISGVPCDSLHRCRRGARRMEWALHMHQPFELVVEREEEVVVLRFTYQQLQPFRLRAP